VPLLKNGSDSKSYKSGENEITRDIAGHSQDGDLASPCHSPSDDKEDAGAWRNDDDHRRDEVLRQACGDYSVQHGAKVANGRVDLRQAARWA